MLNFDCEFMASKTAADEPDAISIGGQIAGVANVGFSPMELSGVQIASLRYAGLIASHNIVGGRMQGAQVGAFNYADEVAGIQVGLVNIANSLKGLQVGLVNINWTGTIPVLPIVNFGF